MTTWPPTKYRAISSSIQFHGLPPGRFKSIYCAVVFPTSDQSARCGGWGTGCLAGPRCSLLEVAERVEVKTSDIGRAIREWR